MKCIVQDCMPNGPWAKHSGMDPGPMASAGLGPSFGQRSWNHGPYCRVEVRGASGPRDSCAVQILFGIFSKNIWGIKFIFSQLSNYQKEKKKKEEPLLMNLKLCLRSIYYLGNVDLNLGV